MEQTKQTQGKDFSFDKIENFEEHIELSIPNYGLLNSIIANMAKYFLHDNTFVYDVGCSSGRLLHNIKTGNPDFTGIKYIGYDIADNLFKKEYEESGIFLIKNDIKNGDVAFNNASLIFSIFTLQFIHESERLKIIDKIYDALLPGGAFIIAEKIYVDSGRMQDIFTFTYYDFKHKSFDYETIFGKQITLRKILKSMDSNGIEKMLSKFNIVEVFFQSLLFKAWVCIK